MCLPYPVAQFPVCRQDKRTYRQLIHKNGCFFHRIIFSNDYVPDKSVCHLLRHNIRGGELEGHGLLFGCLHLTLNLRREGNHLMFLLTLKQNKLFGHPEEIWETL